MPPKIGKATLLGTTKTPETKKTGEKHNLSENGLGSKKPDKKQKKPSPSNDKSDPPPYMTPTPGPPKQPLVDLLTSSPAQKKQVEKEKAEAEKKAAEEENEERELEMTACLQRLESAYQANNNNPDGVTYDLDDIRMLLEDNKRLRAQVNNLDLNKPRTMTEDQIQHMKDQITYMRDDFNKRLEDLHDKKSPTAALAKPLPSVMSPVYHFRLYDPQAIRPLNDLRTRVHQLVVENINLQNARAMFKTAEGDLLPGLEYVCKDKTPFITGSSKPFHLIPLFEGYIWWRLQRYIFDAPLGDWGSRPYAKRREGGPWPGPAVPTLWSAGFGPAFFAYFHEVRDHVREVWPEMLAQLNELRARLATFMDRLHGDPEWDIQVQAIDDVFGKNLIAFVEPFKYNKYLRDALAIVDSALQLDRMFRRSISDWRLAPSKEEREGWKEKKSVLLDPKRMALAGTAGEGTSSGSPPAVKKSKYTMVKESEENAITVLVSPMLIRRGNENGTDYKTAVVVQKARVVTDPELYEPLEELP